MPRLRPQGPPPRRAHRFAARLHVPGLSLAATPIRYGDGAASLALPGLAIVATPDRTATTLALPGLGVPRAVVTQPPPGAVLALPGLGVPRAVVTNVAVRSLAARLALPGLVLAALPSAGRGSFLLAPDYRRDWIKMQAAVPPSEVQIGAPVSDGVRFSGGPGGNEAVGNIGDWSKNKSPPGWTANFTVKKTDSYVPAAGAGSAFLDFHFGTVGDGTTVSGDWTEVVNLAGQVAVESPSGIVGQQDFNQLFYGIYGGTGAAFANIAPVVAGGMTLGGGATGSADVNDVLMVSRVQQQGDFVASFASKMTSTAALPAGQAETGLYFYFGLTGNGSAGRPGEVFTWDQGLAPTTALLKAGASGCLIPLYYRNASGAQTTVFARVIDGAGGVTPITGRTTGTPAFAQNAAYAWTVTRSGNTLTIAQAGAATSTTTITSPLIGQLADSGSFAFLVQPGRTVDLTRFTFSGTPVSLAGMVTGGRPNVWPSSTVSFGFPTAAYPWPRNGTYTDPSAGYQRDLDSVTTPADAALQSATRTALAAWAAASGLTFVDRGTIASRTAAQIKVVYSDVVGAEGATDANTFGPSAFGAGETDGLDGVVMIRADYQNAWPDFLPGGYGFQALIHELGHALGLRHPPFATSVYPYAQTIMNPDTSRESVFATAPRAIDGAAVRMLYGLSSGLVRFTPSSAVIVNPERGFYYNVDLINMSSADFGLARAAGMSLGHSYVDLFAYHTLDTIPGSFLTTLGNSFHKARDNNIKLIVRFAYNVDGTTTDAPKSRILGHIAQLAPIIAANADIIAWMQAGFIGAYGEWHDSANGLDNITDKRDILFALLDAIPAGMFVQQRFPGRDGVAILGAAQLSQGTAYSGTHQARSGNHNDGLLGTEDVGGVTYLNDDGTYPGTNVALINQMKAYDANAAQYTPYSGETSDFRSPYDDGPAAYSYFQTQHLTAVNGSNNQRTINKWKASGHYALLDRDLGYRFQLVDAAFPPTVPAGATFTLTLRVSNVGFCPMFNQRPVFVTLRSGSVRRTVDISSVADPRRWWPGATTTITAQVAVPAGFAAGSCTLGLWLPDAAAGLQADPLHSVQLATVGTWDPGSGENVLGSFAVQAGAAGYPADMAQWDPTFEPAATLIAAHATGARLRFFAQSFAAPGETPDPELAVLAADGTVTTIPADAPIGIAPWLAE